MPFIDIHTHHLQKFEENKIVVLNQTIRDDLFITVSSDENYFSHRSFGLHPWYLDKNKSHIGLEKLETLLKENKIIAVGECGLDKLRGPEMDFQIPIFEAQLKLAEQYKKPVIIHCVRAFNELVAASKNVGADLRVCPRIIHGFNNNKNILKQLLDAGFYISLGSAILKDDTKSKTDWQEKIKMIPPEKLFFETDDSGVDIKSIYERAAVLLEMPMEELKKQIEKNFENVLCVKIKLKTNSFLNGGVNLCVNIFSNLKHILS